MPGTSQFLGQNERDTAHVGVVVRLGTVACVLETRVGLREACCLGPLSWVKGQLVGLSSMGAGLASSSILVGSHTGPSFCFPHL